MIYLADALIQLQQELASCSCAMNELEGETRCSECKSVEIAIFQIERLLNEE